MFAAVVSLVLTPPLGALPQSTERVSVATGGAEANGSSYLQEISANGRFVVFHSDADNLVPGDTNGNWDVFHHDRDSGITTRVSVSSSGAQGNGDSRAPHVSADGRFIAFESRASNLVAGDVNGADDIFVHDLKTGTTELVSQSSGGVLANSVSRHPRISVDGRYVVFVSLASNLAPGDTNGKNDIFRHDRDTGATELISKSSIGAIGNGHSNYADVSADGRFVTFVSSATNLVGGDTNARTDQFVHDTRTDLTTRVSVSSSGVQANGNAHNECAISADGKVVVWASDASNLVVSDTNGHYDIFAHDRSTGTTQRVSVPNFGTQGDLPSLHPAVSADGRFVAFTSSSTNLVVGDTNALDDCFVRDRLLAKTERVSLTHLGGESTGVAVHPSISANGQWVAFFSLGNNLVPGDTNGSHDVFVRDRASAATNNTIILIGPETASVGESVRFEWFTAPSSSSSWFAYSFSATGSVIAGHSFELGSPTVLATSLNSAMGNGFFVSAPLPPAASGLTIYLEAAAMDGSGQLFDSNLRKMVVL